MAAACWRVVLLFLRHKDGLTCRLGRGASGGFDAKINKSDVNFKEQIVMMMMMMKVCSCNKP